ncbi:hypothetical protein [Pseudomonas fluorescens]|uniref:hypothetical protein n=1 Tax=Pseudomonas fluorescens TaxID=294 RepID=UPI0015BF21D7|nr:hypothetical protein [Pseudomonas fluorescens]
MTKIAPPPTAAQQCEEHKTLLAINIYKACFKQKIYRFFLTTLPSHLATVRVELMKTSHTLIQLRQHRSLCLVSARLPG